MVAVANLLPDNPEEEATVLALLKEHPELRTFIQQASAKALDLFPGATIQLDTVRYDDWDPPMRMIVSVPGNLETMMPGRMDYFRWLHTSLNYPEELIFVFTQWAGDTYGGA
ncbi:MAG: hypothetical protein QM589_14745 [Thermomicrobiales bacterium]